MTILETLQKQLTDLAAKRRAQAAKVESIDAPRRELARLEAEEVAAAAEIERIKEQKESLENDLVGVEEFLRCWVPLIDDLGAGKRVFEQLHTQGAFDYATAIGNVQRGDFHLWAVSFQEQLDIIEAHKGKAARLRAEIKEFGGE